MELSTILKALGEDMRLRILGLLLKKELCVCDIETVLGISQANASRHLLKMKSVGLLSSRKNAQWVYYDISVKFRDSHPELIAAFDVEVKKLIEYKNDIKALATIKKTLPDAKC